MEYVFFANSYMYTRIIMHSTINGVNCNILALTLVRGLGTTYATWNNGDSLAEIKLKSSNQGQIKKTKQNESFQN